MVRRTRNAAEHLLTARQVARLLGVSASFLERDRWEGTRIPFIKVDEGAVRYALRVIADFLRAQTRRFAAEASGEPYPHQGRAFRAQSPLVVQFAAYFPYFPKTKDGFLYLFLSGFVIGFAVIFFAI